MIKKIQYFFGQRVRYYMKISGVLFCILCKNNLLYAMLKCSTPENKKWMVSPTDILSPSIRKTLITDVVKYTPNKYIESAKKCPGYNETNWNLVKQEKNTDIYLLLNRLIECDHSQFNEDFNTLNEQLKILKENIKIFNKNGGHNEKEEKNFLPTENGFIFENKEKNALNFCMDVNTRNKTIYLGYQRKEGEITPGILIEEGKVIFAQFNGEEKVGYNFILQNAEDNHVKMSIYYGNESIFKADIKNLDNDDNLEFMLTGEEVCNYLANKSSDFHISIYVYKDLSNELKEKCLPPNETLKDDDKVYIIGDNNSKKNSHFNLIIANGKILKLVIGKNEEDEEYLNRKDKGDTKLYLDLSLCYLRNALVHLSQKEKEDYFTDYNLFLNGDSHAQGKALNCFFEDNKNYNCLFNVNSYNYKSAGNLIYRKNKNKSFFIYKNFSILKIFPCFDDIQNDNVVGSLLLPTKNEVLLTTINKYNFYNSFNELFFDGHLMAVRGEMNFDDSLKMSLVLNNKEKMEDFLSKYAKSFAIITTREFQSNPLKICTKNGDCIYFNSVDGTYCFDYDDIRIGIKTNDVNHLVFYCYISNEKKSNEKKINEKKIIIEYDEKGEICSVICYNDSSYVKIKGDELNKDNSEYENFILIKNKGDIGEKEADQNVIDINVKNFIDDNFNFSDNIKRIKTFTRLLIDRQRNGNSRVLGNNIPLLADFAHTEEKKTVETKSSDKLLEEEFSERSYNKNSDDANSFYCIGSKLKNLKKFLEKDEFFGLKFEGAGKTQEGIETSSSGNEIFLITKEEEILNGKGKKQKNVKKIYVEEIKGHELNLTTFKNFDNLLEKPRYICFKGVDKGKIILKVFGEYKKDEKFSSLFNNFCEAITMLKYEKLIDGCRNLQLGVKEIYIGKIARVYFELCKGNIEIDTSYDRNIGKGRKEHIKDSETKEDVEYVKIYPAIEHTNSSNRPINYKKNKKRKK